MTEESNSGMSSGGGGGLRRRLYVIIFEADTPMGKAFDVMLILAIIASVGAVMLDSVEFYHVQYETALIVAEWIFTMVFTIEYALRLYCAPRPLRYARSFFGIVDLLAVLPTYLSLFFPATRYLLVIRVFRVLRVFRILKVMKYVGEANMLMDALVASRRKVTLFLFAVSTLLIILGSLMYLIEGKEHGFTSIPKSVYWAIVTLTTVGYGDMAPKTDAGQALAAVVMIMGYSIIAVPTGIVSAEMSSAMQGQRRMRMCSKCETASHEIDAHYCRRCGTKL